MLVPLIFLLVGLLLIVLIGYNIVQQFKQKTETDKRISINKQRAVITEVEELLLAATKIPFTKALLLILQNRIRNALIIMMKSFPESAPIREHLKNTDTQIQQIQTNFVAPNQNSLRAPNNDKDALVLLQITKKLRAVLRSEHAKGKITTEIFVTEDRRIELIQLKINLENSIKRITAAKNNKQYGSANQMLTKILGILKGISDKDSYLEQKEALLIEISNEIKQQLVEFSDKEVAAMAAKDKEKKDNLDELFQDKKKW